MPRSIPVKVTEPRRKSRVLVLAHPDHWRRLIEVNLQRQGYLVEAAEDPSFGLARLEMEPWDLLVLDLDAPFYSACDLLRVVKEDSRLSRIPRLLVARSIESAQLCPCAGDGEHIIIKPDDLDALVLLARRLTESVSPRREAMPH